MPYLAEIDLDRSRTPYLCQLRDHVLETVRRHEEEARQRRRAVEERASAEAEREAERRRQLAEQREKEELLRRERQAEEQRQQSQRQQIRAQCVNAFEQSFLTADTSCARLLTTGVYEANDYYHDKAQFVQSWAREHLNIPLDDEQAAAVGETSANVLVTARAGSGKTRVLVTRAIFLQEHCGVPPHQVMLLAFNRAAATEMEKRLRERLSESIPHVMTFHALAHALVHPSEKLLFDDKDDGKLHLTKVVQQIIDKFVRDDEWQGRIRDLMLAYFEADWSRIESGGYHLTGDEFVQFRRSLTQETLKGDRVRNFGQKVIANALVEHGIDYRFDHGFGWSGRRLRSDFLIRNSRETSIYIRYIDETKERAGSDDEWTLLRGSIERAQFKGKLLEFTHEEMQSLGEDKFILHLCTKLREHNLTPERLCRDKLWKEIKDRAVGEFSKAMEQFVGRCRQRNWLPRDLDIEIIRHAAIPGASRTELEFYRIGSAVYNAYLEHLGRNGREDFNGLMLRAAEAAAEGTLSFGRKGNNGSIKDLRYLHIDEYQDFSRSFYNLTQAMRSRNPKMEVFCVGDDWQAVNGFAGSDLSYFRGFDTHFAPAKAKTISHNYRSAARIVETSNLLLGDDDAKARAVQDNGGQVYVCDLESFVPLATERQRRLDLEISTTSEGYEIALGRLTYYAAKQGSVVLLNRTHNPDVIPGGSLESALAMLRETLPAKLQERVTASTAHGYKGLEEDSVIVLDAVANHYPLIHPHWMFGRIFSDSLDTIEQDERRLFYVALTRAKKNLFICTQASKMSPFLAEIEGDPVVHRLDWRSLKPVPHDEPERCEIRVHDSYDVREQLNADGFAFKDAQDWHEKHWSRVMCRSKVTQAWIRDAPWNDGRAVIRIYGEAGTLIWSSEANGIDTWDPRGCL